MPQPHALRTAAQTAPSRKDENENDSTTSHRSSFNRCAYSPFNVGVNKYNPDIYNLTDDEIREIHKSGGVGVIFYTYWLDANHPKNGLAAIWNTMKHISEVTGSWDSVLLGTDFDGFTDPPNDVKDASQMGKVTQMLLEKGLGEADIKKILGGNALRILEKGWRS